MQKQYQGKVVIVTGAGRGIGRSIAEEFAAEGAHVVIAARTPSYGEDAVAAIQARGGSASLFQIDVNDQQRVKELVEDTASRFGGVDIVVHSAADIPHGGVMDVTDEAIDKGISSIIKAAFWLTRAAVPWLKQSRDGGRLIFISSIVGPQTVLPGRAAYAVAKNGLNAFIRAAALDLSRENITVNGVEPGLVASARAKANMSEDALNAFASTLPVPRAATPEEIAHVCLFLASPRSGYITGENIVIDGGATLSTSKGISKQLVDHKH